MGQMYLPKPPGGFRLPVCAAYRDICGKTATLSGFQQVRRAIPFEAVKANTKLILAEEDNIKHIFSSLATKVTSQSVIIGKLSSYARKNGTKKALWEQDNLKRSRYLLSYGDSPRLRPNVQRALNRADRHFPSFAVFKG